MIIFRNKILEEFFIDPVTAIITNSKGEIQKTTIHKNGRPYFKSQGIHEWQVHTHVGYQRGMVIHHIDENKFNNSLSNLVYLTNSEHRRIHMKGKNNPMYGKHLSEETKRKIGEASKERNAGENHPFYSKHHTEEAKRKISDARKGKTPLNKGKRYKCINNGVENRFIPLNEDIPEGFSRGRLKKWMKMYSKSVTTN